MELQRPFAAVTSSLDGDVLAVLARVDVEFTTGQVHRLLPSHSQEGVRHVLQRLARQGTVTADRVGNAYTYRLNRDHLAAPYLIALANLMSELLARIEHELAGWDPQPAYAAVFGSAVRGTMTADSDIDLLLVRPTRADSDAWDEQVATFTSLVTRWTGNDARALILDESEVRPNERVLRDVLEHGLTVAGTHDWLARRLRRAKADK